MAIKYAGIGSRETPPEILSFMKMMGSILGTKGYILRTGGAPGADTAFLEGAVFGGGEYELFIPWRGFNNHHSNGTVCGDDPQLQSIAAKFHPAWASLSRGPRALHARNVAQVLGRNTKDHSSFVLCWTKGGLGQGGTGQAIRIAKGHNIPVLDLGKPETLDALRELLREIGDGGEGCT